MPRNNEAILAIAGTAQAFLRTVGIDLLRSGAASATMFEAMAALNRYEHLPCTLDEKCQHQQQKELPPEMEAVYEQLRNQVRQGIIALLDKGASADAVKDAIIALGLLEHIDPTEESNPKSTDSPRPNVRTTSVSVLGMPEPLRSIFENIARQERNEN